MVTRLARTLIWLASASAAVAFVVVVARRMGSPAELDPIEGALLDLARRIAEHRPLYVEPPLPSPVALMPGVPAVVSLLVRYLGPQLWEPRAVSLAATLVTAGLIFAIVRAETVSWTLAAGGTGLMFAGYALIVGQPEVARPETLMLALLLAGLTTLRYTQGVVGALLAALLLSAACFTHVAALWFVAAALAYLALEDRGRAYVVAPTFAILVGGGHIVLSRMLGPWFNFYAYDLPFGSLHFDPTRLLQFVGTQVLGRLGVLSLAAVLSFALPTPPWRGLRGLWLWMGAGMLGAGLLASQSPGIGTELLLPGVVVLAVLGSVSMHSVTRHLAAWPGSSRGEGHGIVLVALAIQFLVIFAALPSPLASAWGLASDSTPASPRPAATAVSAATGANSARPAR